MINNKRKTSLIRHVYKYITHENEQCNISADHSNKSAIAIYDIFLLYKSFGKFSYVFVINLPVHMSFNSLLFVGEQFPNAEALGDGITDYLEYMENNDEGDSGDMQGWYPPLP